MNSLPEKESRCFNIPYGPNGELPDLSHPDWTPSEPAYPDGVLPQVALDTIARINNKIEAERIARLGLDMPGIAGELEAELAQLPESRVAAGGIAAVVNEEALTHGQ